MKVGYQGVHGSFSEIATMRYFADEQIEMEGYTSFPSILQAVKDGDLDYAVLPVENTTTGIIARTYDLFGKYNVFAVGEINVEIRQDLIGFAGTEIEEITDVYSHPEALSQCAEFFASHPWITQHPYQDTAKSVEMVKESGDHHLAALGSYRAAEYYNMTSLIPAVQDSSTNMTRFLIVTNHEEVVTDADKVSLMLVTRHVPGALYNILGMLAKNGINIVRLESRPIQGRNFNYLFYMDFLGNTQDKDTRKLLKEMELRCEAFKLLGCYKTDNRQPAGM